MKKQVEFPITRMIADSVPAAAIGVNVRTWQRRRKNPESITLGELKKAVRYKAISGDAPIDLLRELLQKDFTI